MKFISNNLTFLTLNLFIVFIFVGFSACTQSNKAKFTKDDFEKLRWLEGTWRGSEADGQHPFFERYRFVGDAKIEIDSFSDATLNKVTSQSSFYFENEQIFHRNGPMIWTASKLDESFVDFIPKEKATRILN